MSPFSKSNSLLNIANEALDAGVMTKSVLDAEWGGNWSQSNQNGTAGTVSMKAIETASKELHPTVQYELVIAVRACVDAICKNLSKIAIRIFDRSGREIVGGPLYDLMRCPGPHLSRQKFITKLTTWYNISGEMAAVCRPDGSDGVRSIEVVDPYFFQPLNPANPRTLEEIMQWRYYWKNGQSEDFRADYVLFEHMFNPKSEIRGLAPLVTGSTEVATSYHLSRYNKSFFENGAIPSHILNLGKGVGASQRRDIQERYEGEFSHLNGQAHKVLVVGGSDSIKIEQLEQPFQDGAFMALKQGIRADIAQLYRVPAIEAGIYDKTRFDTAAEERKMFVESTLEPQCNVISQMLQSQLVDPHFSFSDVNRERAKFTKSMDSQYQQAFYERPDSNLIILLDINSLPIMAEVKSAQISMAASFQKTLSLSPSETIEYFKLEIPHRPERDEIWIDKQLQCITDTDLNGKIVGAEMAAKQQINGGSNDPNKPDAKDATPPVEPKPSKKAMKTLLHKLRGLTFDALENGNLFSLADADELAGEDPVLTKAVRIVRYRLRNVTGEEDPMLAAKSILNALEPDEFIGDE